MISWTFSVFILISLTVICDSEKTVRSEINVSGSSRIRDPLSGKKQPFVRAKRQPKVSSQNYVLLCNHRDIEDIFAAKNFKYSPNI